MDVQCHIMLDVQLVGHAGLQLDKYASYNHARMFEIQLIIVSVASRELNSLLVFILTGVIRHPHNNLARLVAQAHKHC